MFKVQHSINIEIDEQGLKQLIIDEIARQNPTIAVDDIKFTQRRNPTEIEVAVTGHVEDGATHASVSGTTEVATPAIVDESEEVIEEAVEQEEETLDAASQLLAEEAEESLDDMLADEEPEEEEEEDPFAD